MSSMKDRLTKKRIRVDYSRIIKVLGLSEEFTAYLWSKRPCMLSWRRYEYAFLKAKRVYIDQIYFYLRDNPHINTYMDFIAAGNKPSDVMDK